MSREARGGETRNEFNAWKNLCLATGSCLAYNCPSCPRTAANEPPEDRIPKRRFPSAETARREAFSRGMRELGYVEGKTIIIEASLFRGKLQPAGRARDRAGAPKAGPDRYRRCPSTRAAKEVTGTIPIVMTNDPDPVANGFVAGLALPAGNVTGLSTLAPELSGKRLGILREVIPTITRIAVLATSTSPASRRSKKRSTSPPRLSSCSFNTKTFWIAKTSNRHFELQPKVERMRSSRSTAVFWFPKPRRLCRSPQRAGSRQRIAKLSTLTLGD